MRLSKFVKVCALALALAVVTPSIAPMNNVAVAEAATAIKLNKTKLSLNVGDTAKLKISGTKSKVTWATSKKTVATVDKTGKVTAVKAGSATITATVNKKKYTCKVTVKAVNPNIAKAPFKAQEVVFGDFKGVIPKGWTSQLVAEQDGATITAFYSSAAKVDLQTSGVVIKIIPTGQAKADYSMAKEYFAGAINPEILVAQYAAQGIEATVSDFKTSDYESTLGTTYRSEFVLTSDSINAKYVYYDVFIDNYLIEIAVADAGDNMTPDVYEVGEYLLNTLVAAK